MGGFPNHQIILGNPWKDWKIEEKSFHNNYRYLVSRGEQCDRCSASCFAESIGEKILLHAV